MTTLSSLTLDIFLLAHAHLQEDQAGEGAAFERRIRHHLISHGLPDARTFRVFSGASLSGLYHQIDEQTKCEDVLVVCEWKSYQGRIAKNDLLRFKAATDDYWLGNLKNQGSSVVRIFGGTGEVSDSMRTYAAQWGIILVTPDRWPIPTLCDPDLLWSLGDLRYPRPPDCRVLQSLVRPISDVFAVQTDGSWRTQAIPSATEIQSRVDLWQLWSDRAWEWWDGHGARRFEMLLEQRVNGSSAAA